MRTPIFTLILISSTLGPTAHAELNMKSGLWETTVNLQGHAMPPQRKCYLKKDIIALEKIFQGKWAPRGDPCRYTDYQRDGNVIRYNMTCKFGDEEKISLVAAEYNGDNANSAILQAGASGTTLSRRVGSCKRSSFP